MVMDGTTMSNNSNINTNNNCCNEIIDIIKKKNGSNCGINSHDNSESYK